MLYYLRGLGGDGRRELGGSFVGEVILERMERSDWDSLGLEETLIDVQNETGRILLTEKVRNGFL